jgi:hypothetical protein
MTLAKYYESNEGRKALLAATRSSYFQMQEQSSLGNGHPRLNEIEALKRSELADYQGGEDGGSADPATIDWTDEKQATAAFRAEKARKERSQYQGSHQGENKNRRSMLSDHLNNDAAAAVKTAKAIDGYMKAGMTREQAATRVLRQERDDGRQDNRPGSIWP